MFRKPELNERQKRCIANARAREKRKDPDQELKDAFENAKKSALKIFATELDLSETAYTNGVQIDLKRLIAAMDGVLKIQGEEYERNLKAYLVKSEKEYFTLINESEELCT